MSLQRDPDITPAIEELRKLKIEKREIESMMAFSEPGMESYQRRIKQNLNSIDTRIEEYKKVIRDGYILKIIQKKKNIARYNETLRLIDAPEISYDSIEIGSDVDDRGYEDRKLFIINSVFEEIYRLKNEKKQIESMMAFSESGVGSAGQDYSRRIMLNINSIDARIEECKTIIRDEYRVRVIHIKKDIARYNEILRLIKIPGISYDSIEIGVEGGILLPPSAIPSGVVKAKPIGRGGGTRRRTRRKRTRRKRTRRKTRK
jgi:hypothetical protein